MACTNCAWEELVALGVGCDVLEGSVDEAYTACAADCNAECADDIGALKTCAMPLFCGEESTLKIAQRRERRVVLGPFEFEARMVAVYHLSFGLLLMCKIGLIQ